MKIYMLGTIGGSALCTIDELVRLLDEAPDNCPEGWDNSFATCEAGCLDGEHYVGPNQLSWWRWGDTCPACGTTSEIKLVPWKMRWTEGSDCIGDFAGTGVPNWDSLAQKKVIDFFHSNDFFVNEFETIFLEVPPRSPQSRTPRYPIVYTSPYEGPPFWGFVSRYGVHMNEEKSQKKRLECCSVCGKIRYDTDKIFDDDEGDYFWQNFVIDEEEWNGLKLFGVFEFGHLLMPGDGVFLSEEGHDELLKQGFTNLKCEEVGRIEKAGHGKMKPYREQADYDFWKPDEFVPPPPEEKTKKQRKK